MAKTIGTWMAKSKRALGRHLGPGAGHVWLPLVLVSMALLVMTTAVRAHGGSGYYLVRGVPVGEYITHVWVSPGVMRTGEVHVDTALFDREGTPALLPLIRVSLTPLDGKSPPQTAVAGPPAAVSPFARDARFMLERPGIYQLEIDVDDGASGSGVMDMEVKVQAVSWAVKLALIAGVIATAGCGVWLLLETKKFWRAEEEGEGSA